MVIGRVVEFLQKTRTGTPHADTARARSARALLVHDIYRPAARLFGRCVFYLSAQNHRESASQQHPGAPSLTQYAQSTDRGSRLSVSLVALDAVSTRYSKERTRAVHVACPRTSIHIAQITHTTAGNRRCCGSHDADGGVPTRPCRRHRRRRPRCCCRLLLPASP